MSDGPYRSLQMRKPWRELAKRGEQLTYDQQEVAEAATAALESDFKREVKWSLINALKAVFACESNSLMIPEIALMELEAVRPLAAGSVFGQSAVEWSICLVKEGYLAPDAAYTAIGLAAKDRGYANARSIQEHALRETSERIANGIADRVNGAISKLSEHDLGASLVNRGEHKRVRSRKRANIDDGVRF